LVAEHPLPPQLQPPPHIHLTVGDIKSQEGKEDSLLFMQIDFGKRFARRRVSVSAGKRVVGRIGAREKREGGGGSDTCLESLAGQQYFMLHSQTPFCC